MTEKYEPVYAKWTTERCAVCRWVEDWDYNKIIICIRYYKWGTAWALFLSIVGSNFLLDVRRKRCTPTAPSVSDCNCIYGELTKFLYSTRCQIAVHQECYGARNVRDITSWVCKACETPEIKRECCLCPVKGFHIFLFSLEMKMCPGFFIPKNALSYTNLHYPIFWPFLQR